MSIEVLIQKFLKNEIKPKTLQTRPFHIGLIRSQQLQNNKHLKDY